MFLTRLVLLGTTVLAFATLTGCVTHSRVLYQPKPFKMATVPQSSTSSRVPADESPTPTH